MAAETAPRGVRIISVVHFLLAGFWGLIALFCGFLALSGGSSGGMFSIPWTAFATAGAVSVAISGGLAGLGYGLFEGKTWARGAAIVLSSLPAIVLARRAWAQRAADRTEEFVRRVQRAALHDQVHAARRSDVCERIPLDHEKVGEFPRLDTAQPVADTDSSCAIDGPNS